MPLCCKEGHYDSSGSSRVVVKLKQIQLHMSVLAITAHWPIIPTLDSAFPHLDLCPRARLTSNAQSNIKLSLFNSLCLSCYRGY